MDAASGLGAPGKNRKKYAKVRNAMATMLTGTPDFPRLNFEAGKGSPRSRLASTQPITTMYEVNRPVADTDKMILKAVVEPMILNEGK